MSEYTIALYIRLSQEDDNVGESNSVKNQRDLLTDFAMKHPDLSKGKLLYFIDDGHSGTDFDRPAVKDMLDQVRKGKIQCIAVKDFSRFGRNYIEVGSYLEQVFPFLGVRFLSVNDFFDSDDNKGRSAGIEVGFKTLIHDLYSRDLSIKSKSGKLAKTQKGEHISGSSPFGYVKSKTVKNAWEIDESAAVTIRKIYALVLDGMGITEIAKTLNSEGIPAPLAHRMNNNTHHGIICRKVDEIPLWRPANVTRFLRDERYTGKIVTGTMSKGKFGIQKTKTTFHPKSEWIIVPDAHEPIIPQETFDMVQSTLKPYNARTIKKENRSIFARKLFCVYCHHTLRRYGGLNPKYVCRSGIELGANCLTDTIYEADIAEAVLAALKVELALAATSKKQTDKQNKLVNGKRAKLSGEVKRLSTDVSRMKNSRASLFEDYTDGKLTKEQYISVKAELSGNIEEAEAEIVRLSDEIQRQEQTKQTSDKYEMLSPFDGAAELTSEMMSLVKGIYVYDATRIEIKFAFSDESDRILADAE
jgi:DNA invertase Pin-like site-specific DNA recombinase